MAVLFAGWGYKEVTVSFIGGMKCLISLNSPELVKDFVTKTDVWKDHLSSAVLWEGQEIPYERVVNLRMEGLPIVLREEETYRKIAGLYGKVIEPLDISWDSFDVSAGSLTNTENFATGCKIRFRSKRVGYNSFMPTKSFPATIFLHRQGDQRGRDRQRKVGALRGTIPTFITSGRFPLLY
ncbi:hypothetical protein L1987_35611 [Smallanthus sonchifolius]|uniref:Uncharacterized protein n=1 Tax=Smallanthus sonchifolius TaxID=185202 RepID=A0ACB9HAV4_9ASTR|nr:hypothetical protein L1987_35611 [Smallanthus sonchifolius]